jgi:cytochrome c oxidase subunit 4
MSQPKVMPRTYFVVFAILILLTAATVALSQVDLGAWHGVVGLAIAAAKGTLVVMFFMHLLYSSRLTWVFALSGLAWLCILLGLTLTDFLTRDWPLK